MIAFWSNVPSVCLGFFYWYFPLFIHGVNSSICWYFFSVCQIGLVSIIEIIFPSIVSVNGYFLAVLTIGYRYLNSLLFSYANFYVNMKNTFSFSFLFLLWILAYLSTCNSYLFSMRWMTHFNYSFKKIIFLFN